MFDAVTPSADYINTCDYLISTEVFEHVVHPVARAFDSARKVLRSGGVFVFTVPFTNATETKEHFPHLHEYKLVELEGEHILVNKRRDGEIETHRNLVFHGGPGTTLEMRVFCRADVIKHLEQAGFIDIRVMDENVPEFGIIHKQPWSVPVVARVA
jgi:SAM-dependent methyltransferase